jgi:hypothetical protein
VKGEVEEVKRENMLVIFVNAFREQQAQIARHQEELKR